MNFNEKHLVFTEDGQTVNGLTLTETLERFRDLGANVHSYHDDSIWTLSEEDINPIFARWAVGRMSDLDPDDEDEFDMQSFLSDPDMASIFSGVASLVGSKLDLDWPEETEILIDIRIPEYLDEEQKVKIKDLIDRHAVAPMETEEDDDE